MDIKTHDIKLPEYIKLFDSETINQSEFNELFNNAMKNVKKSWGDKDNDIIDVNKCIAYIINLVKFSNKFNLPLHRLYFVCENSMTIEKEDEKSFKDIGYFVDSIMSSKISTNDRVYICINVPSTLRSNMSHQNWFCINFGNLTIERFEPSWNYEEFKGFDIFVHYLTFIIKQKMNIDLKYVINEGAFRLNNSILACRLNSTFLASLHIFNIPIEKIKHALYNVYCTYVKCKLKNKSKNIDNFENLFSNKNDAKIMLRIFTYMINSQIEQLKLPQYNEPKNLRTTHNYKLRFRKRSKDRK